MLKILMFIFAMVTTVIRLITLVYLSLQDRNNLPVVVIILIGILVLLGIYIIGKRLLGTLHLRELVLFYLVSSIFIIFNLVYVAATLPLQLSLWESLAIGSILEVLVDALFLYYSWKQVRSLYVSVDHTLEDDKKE